MNRKMWIPTLALVVAVLSGCGQSSAPVTPSGTSGDEPAAVSATLAMTPEVIDDGAFDLADVGVLDSRSAVGSDALAMIHPYRYWRTIMSVRREFTFTFGDTDSTGRPRRCVVAVHKTLRGQFHIVAGPAGEPNTAADSQRTVVNKPLTDLWTRRLLLQRITIPDSVPLAGSADRSRWRVVATSGVQVHSQNTVPTHVNLTSLHIVAGSLDTVITHPLEFFRLRHVLKFAPGTQVTLTATTGAPDDIVVFFRAGQRIHLAANGDGTYTGTWTVPDAVGLRHFGVNAFARSTLFDDQAPYNSEAWIFPYVVPGQELADQIP